MQNCQYNCYLLLYLLYWVHFWSTGFKDFIKGPNSKSYSQTTPHSNINDTKLSNTHQQTFDFRTVILLVIAKTLLFARSNIFFCVFRSGTFSGSHKLKDLYLENNVITEELHENHLQFLVEMLLYTLPCL